ncbi:hypothetical protein CAC42_1524 [Sphaceloma murrayae]|uniref:Transcription factor TFIIIC triple barrel domain-containing protein n=1 Tax=Sphaceloma murrayae TaxID=2082308 RepID=A0A2K1R2Z3_9PEZI|nr:hypothetical protein CAC42_1524 [Sphaceloma murrayae]
MSSTDIRDGTQVEDEWEYEYDKEQHEIIYITVDFSTHAPPGLPSKMSTDTLPQNDHRKIQSMNARRPRKRKRAHVEDDEAAVEDTMTPDETGLLTSQLTADDEDQDTTVIGPSAGLEDLPLPPHQAPKHLESAVTPDSKTIQILDLHSRNPLITYNSRFYTCHWATDLGTSLYLSPPPSTVTGPTHAPLRSFPTFDILTKTRARLVAVPAVLRPRVPTVPTTTDSATEPSAPPLHVPGPEDFTISTAEGDTIHYSESGRLKITTPSDASDAKKAQAAFLERWSELKEKKGWRDPIPVKAMRNYRVPEGWEEERRRWAEIERRHGILGMGFDGGGEGMVKSRRRRRGVGIEMRGVKGRKPGRPGKIVIESSEGEDGADDDEDDEDEEDDDRGGGEGGDHAGMPGEEDEEIPGTGIMQF